MAGQEDEVTHCQTYVSAAQNAQSECKQTRDQFPPVLRAMTRPFYERPERLCFLPHRTDSDLPTESQRVWRRLPQTILVNECVFDAQLKFRKSFAGP